MKNSIIAADAQTLEAYREKFDIEFKQDRKELDSYSLSLDKDATSKSPKVLYQKLFMAREYTNRSGVLYSKYVKLSLLAKKLILQKSEERRVRLAAIFRVNSIELSKFRSGEEKNRFCESLLDPSFEQAFIHAKLLEEETKGYVQFFKMQYDFYKEIKSDILTQLGIIRSMLMLGELPLVNDLNSYEKDIDINSEFDDKVIIGEGRVSI